MMDMVATFLLAHLLADFPLQTNAMAASKATSLRVLLLHSAVHMVSLWALLNFDWRTWPIFFGLGLAHFGVDWLKPRIKTLSTVQGFIFDQLAHLTCILLMAALVDPVLHLQVHQTLSTTLLYPSFGIGLSLAAMVFGWIWINSLQEEIIQQNNYLRWGQERLLEFEQRTGLGLLCVLGLSIFWVR